MYVLFPEIGQKTEIGLQSFNNIAFLIRWFSAEIDGISRIVSGISLEIPTDANVLRRYMPKFYNQPMVGDRIVTKGYPAFDIFARINGLNSNELTARRLPIIQIQDFKALEQNGSAFVKAFKELIAMSKRMSSIKGEVELVNAIINEQTGNNQEKTQRVLEYYECFKDVKILVLANMDIVADTTKKKLYYGEKGMQMMLRRLFNNKEMLKDNSVDEPLATLIRYKELIGNREFLFDNVFNELIDKLREFGLTVEW